MPEDAHDLAATTLYNGIVELAALVTTKNSLRCLCENIYEVVHPIGVPLKMQ